MMNALSRPMLGPNAAPPRNWWTRRIRRKPAGVHWDFIGQSLQP